MSHGEVLCMVLQGHAQVTAETDSRTGRWRIDKSLQPLYPYDDTYFYWLDVLSGAACVQVAINNISCPGTSTWYLAEFNKLRRDVNYTNWGDASADPSAVVKSSVVTCSQNCNDGVKKLIPLAPETSYAPVYAASNASGAQCSASWTLETFTPGTEGAKPPIAL